MPAVALDTSESCQVPLIPSRASHESSPDSSTQQAPATSVPRFNLRKRVSGSSDDQVNLVTVNSAFLSGLFADVAKVQEGEPDEGREARVTVTEDSDPRLDDSKPLKKTRLSMTKSISRCGRSYKFLNEAVVSPTSSPAPCPGGALDAQGAPAMPAFGMEKENSLHFQLHCVSSASGKRSRGEDTSALLDAGRLAFPNLPTTISNSSCNTLTRNLSDLQSSLAESAQHESYGWFVEMDNEDLPESSLKPFDAYAAATTSELAFSAVTAPKASDHDAEVEWAKAADTVDEVLGDFF